MSAQKLEHYLNYKFTYQITWDADSNAFGATILELPGCVATGDTYMEALEALEEAKHAYLEVSLSEGWEIPEPSDAGAYSGKVLVRMASTLHMQLAQWAQQEGVSLNQLVITALAHAAGTRMLQPMCAPSNGDAAFSAEVEAALIQARRMVETGLDCDRAMAPLRELLLASYERSPLTRNLLALVDLMGSMYHLAEIRTRQKEMEALARRAQKIAARVQTKIIRSSLEANEVERDQDLAGQSWQTGSTSHDGIPVPNWPTTLKR